MNRKHILCYGDSNTWGYEAATLGRYDDDTRWTMQLQHLLGDQYLIQEAGLSGRTSVVDDPLNEGLNGLTTLLPTMMTHAPLDLMILMLGTNDTKSRFGLTAKNITDGLMRLIKKAKQVEAWADKPNILVVAPIIIGEKIYQHPEHGVGMGPGCVEKSRELPERFRHMARLQGCHFMDINPHVTAADNDYMHLDKESNARFARALYELVPTLIS